MIFSRHSTLAVILLALAACSADESERNASADAAGSSGPIRTALATPQGGEAGIVTVSEDSTGVTIKVEAAGLEPGPHGVHLHAVGRCDPPSFNGAGPHWNPLGKQHGRDNPDGPHLGDLANLDAGDDGRGASTFLLPGIRLRDGETPLVDLDGAALVIHQRADDYKSDPSGASGDRVACAVLEP